MFKEKNEVHCNIYPDFSHVGTMFFFQSQTFLKMLLPFFALIRAVT